MTSLHAMFRWENVGGGKNVEPRSPCPLRSLRSQDNHLLAKPSVYTSIASLRCQLRSSTNLERHTSKNTNLTISEFILKRNSKTYYLAAAL